MDSLLSDVLGLDLTQWLGLFLLIVASALITGVARAVIGLIASRFGLQEKLAPTSVKGLMLAVTVMATTILWYVVEPLLELPEAPESFIRYLLIFGAVLGGALLICAAFDVTLDASAARASKLVSRADHILIPITRKLGKFVILITAGLIFAASVGVNVAGVITGLGITGLLFALAAKDSVENIFGSITILFDMPFGLGDKIKTSSVEGVVEEINLRSTRIRTTTDSLVTLPNSNLIRASVENFGSRRYRPVNLSLLLAYSNSLANIKDFSKRVRKLVTKHPKVRADNAYVHIFDLREGFIELLIEFQIMTDSYPEELELRETLLTQILEAAEGAKVVLGSLPWQAVDTPKGELPQNSGKVAESKG